MNHVFSLFLPVRGPPRPLPGQCRSAGQLVLLVCYFPHKGHSRNGFGLRPGRGSLGRGAHLWRFMRSHAPLAARAHARIAGGACACAHPWPFMRTRVVSMRIAGCARARASPAVLAHACGARARSSQAFHAHTCGAHHQRRTGMCTRAFALWGGRSSIPFQACQPWVQPKPSLTWSLHGR